MNEEMPRAELRRILEKALALFDWYQNETTNGRHVISVDQAMFETLQGNLKIIQHTGKRDCKNLATLIKAENLGRSRIIEPVFSHR